jgi:crossover junction endodeoxyribonuclease RuvC
MDFVLGVDPGLSGALARIGYVDAVCSGPGYKTWDAPTAKDGKHTVLLPVEMRRILEEAIGGYPASATIVFIEKVHAFPKQGRSGIFNFGDGYGMWKGICVGLGLPYELVTPQRWQKEMLAGMQGGKDASCIRAQELFPEADLKKGPRSKKLHDGRADSLLIAEYGRRTYGSS